MGTDLGNLRKLKSKAAMEKTEDSTQNLEKARELVTGISRLGDKSGVNNRRVMDKLFEKHSVPTVYPLCPSLTHPLPFLVEVCLVLSGESQTASLESGSTVEGMCTILKRS